MKRRKEKQLENCDMISSTVRLNVTMTLISTTKTTAEENKRKLGENCEKTNKARVVKLQLLTNRLDIERETRRDTQRITIFNLTKVHNSHVEVM